MTTQITNSTKEIIERYTIEYDNGVSCNVTKVNDHIQSHTFHKGGYSLMCIDNLDELQNLHWEFHHEYVELADIPADDLLNFDKFDQLVHIGGSMDGMLRDMNGTPLSSVILLDGSFMKHMLHVDTNDKLWEYKELFKALPETVFYEVSEVPYYNQAYNGELELTVELKVSNELYKKYINEYLDLDAKQAVCNDLLF